METDENAVEIGHVTIFFNTEKDGALLLPYGKEPEVVNDVVALVRDKINDNALLSDRVQIDKVTWTRGCLVIEIKLAALGVAIYKFVKDYPDLRKGIQQLSADLKHLTVTVQETGVVLQGLVYSQALISIEEMKRVVNDAKKQLTKVTSRLLGNSLCENRIDHNSDFLLHEVANYVQRKYVSRAIISGNSSFSVVAGKLKGELDSPVNLPDLCTILGSEMFEKLCDVRRAGITGPVNKPDMTFTYTAASLRSIALPLIQ